MEINTHASASALAKLLGIDYKVAGEFKEFLEASELKTISKTHIIKDKPVKYQAYNIMAALEYTYKDIRFNKEEIESSLSETTTLPDTLEIDLTNFE